MIENVEQVIIGALNFLWKDLKTLNIVYMCLCHRFIY